MQQKFIENLEHFVLEYGGDDNIIQHQTHLNLFVI